MMPGVAGVDSPGAGSVVASPRAAVVCFAAPDFPWWPAPGEFLYAPAPDRLSSHSSPAGELPAHPGQCWVPECGQ